MDPSGNEEWGPGGAWGPPPPPPPWAWNVPVAPVQRSPQIAVGIGVALALFGGFATMMYSFVAINVGAGYQARHPGEPDHAIVLVLTPWLGLVAAVVLVIAWGADLLQHGRSPWPACVTAAGLYLVPLVVSCMLLP